MYQAKDIINFQLENGLRVILRPLHNSQVAVVNMMYFAGSRNENSNKTGLAHLLEHVMCSGSKHIASYDEALQKAGAESNAYTSFDVTNYWSMLPVNKVPHALWVESERMFFPRLTEEVVNIQKKIVLEEFKETVLSKPYGDIWHHLLPEVYRHHPYQWPIIGKNLKQIGMLELEDIEKFMASYYHPANAVLSIVGGIDPDALYLEVKRWFSLPAFDRYTQLKALSPEPTQVAKRSLIIERKVPQNALYFAYRMGGYADKTHIITEAISHILTGGKSALLYHELIEKKAIFTDIQAYTLDTLDPGLLIIEGKLQTGVAFATAEDEVKALLEDIAKGHLPYAHVDKAFHQVESSYWFDQMELTNNAEELAWNMYMGDPLLTKNRIEKKPICTYELLVEHAQKIFQEQKMTVVHYKAAS